MSNLNTELFVEISEEQQEVVAGGVAPGISGRSQSLFIRLDGVGLGSYADANGAGGGFDAFVGRLAFNNTEIDTF